MKNAKVLVGIPLTEPTFYSQYRETVVRHIEDAMKGVDHEIFVNRPTSDKGPKGIAEATNKLAEKCIRERWDYLWIVEGDVEVPEHAFRRLFMPKADINLGIYPNHRDDLRMMAGYFRIRSGGNPPTVVSVNDIAALKGKVFKTMVCAGIGCALIKRRVFESGLRFIYDMALFRAKVGVHDQLFLYEAQVAGFKTFLHGDVICGHLPEWSLTKLASSGA